MIEEKKPFLEMPETFWNERAEEDSVLIGDVREMRDKYEARIAELEVEVEFQKGLRGELTEKKAQAIARAEKLESIAAERIEEVIELQGERAQLRSDIAEALGIELTDSDTWADECVASIQHVVAELADRKKHDPFVKKMLREVHKKMLAACASRTPFSPEELETIHSLEGLSSLLFLKKGGG